MDGLPGSQLCHNQILFMCGSFCALVVVLSATQKVLKRAETMYSCATGRSSCLSISGVGEGRRPGKFSEPGVPGQVFRIEMHAANFASCAVLYRRSRYEKKRIGGCSI
jgi:hypothetical protein